MSSVTSTYLLHHTPQSVHQRLCVEVVIFPPLEHRIVYHHLYDLVPHKRLRVRLHHVQEITEDFCWTFHWNETKQASSPELRFFMTLSLSKGIQYHAWHLTLRSYCITKLDMKRPVNMVTAKNQFNSYSASHDNWCTVGGDRGCRVGEVQAGTTSPMPDHKGFKL